MNDTVGIFYELPCGRIAKTYGFNKPKQQISYYFDDNNGSHTVSVELFQSWKPRPDLTDFPNARDPKLPYEFDLYWDIKYLSELQQAIFHNHDDLDAIQQAVTRHQITV